MFEVAIVAAKRTAVGNFAGTLASVSADELGATVIRQLLLDTGVAADQISEVILGQVLTGGQGQNPARKATINAGLPNTCPAMTINKVCGSGLKAVSLGVQAIVCGDAEVVIAGGQENMSQSGHILSGSRDGFRMGNASLVDTMLRDGLTDTFGGYHMGMTAENVARLFNISREEQDEFAAASQQKACRARAEGRFDDEIVPVTVPQSKKDPIEFNEDEFIRDGVTAEALGKLRPAFDREGTVTAGNASGINDGAAAVMLMAVDKAKQLELPILATVKAYASAAVDPEIMGTGPIPATGLCLKKAGWTHADLDLVEANEAFAAQAIGVNKGLCWDVTKVNVNGGAIAIGHPIGASGCRILVSLIHELIKRDKKKGLATLCIGGGQGVALAIER
ncbi:MAG: acetyl-CoA C-acyltransferase [Gammaproteobacteria bacterium]|nr:acetyl-CoA C-acyltransferase [Gammaproteobacteria bacterium]|tara:strand:- start:355 stop:1533 length:1179 start_codon:yes stop_codon:yes gene_type:complete